MYCFKESLLVKKVSRCAVKKLSLYVEHYPPPPRSNGTEGDVYRVVVLTAKGPYSLEGRIRLHMGGGVVTIFGKLTSVNT